MDEPVRDRNRFICVMRRIPMLVNLGVEGADLHVGFALVLEQFYLE